jgi:hypothetical protein
MDEKLKLKMEQADVRAGVLELMNGEKEFVVQLTEAYEHLSKDAWVNQVAQNVVKSNGYDKLNPVEASSWLALTVEVADLIKDRLNRRFDMVVCVSTTVFPYVDTVGEYKAVVCETLTFNVPYQSAEAIADTLAALIRLTARDEDDTLFIYRLCMPMKFGFNISGAEVEAQHPKYTTKFGTVRRKV